MIYPNPLLNLFAEISQSDLKRQLQYLKAENIILREHCRQKRLYLNDRQRQKLLKFGLPLGPQIKHLISIVDYSTFRRWVKEMSQPPRPPDRRGRPRIITLQLKRLIVEMYRLNKFGYTKILAELKKLQIRRISRTSVANILKEYGINSRAHRSEDTWDQFLKRTFETLWACDFFTKTVWTPFGRRMYYVLFFINIKTRRVQIAGITKKVTKQWLREQTEKLGDVFKHDSPTAALVRDRDVKYVKEFDQFFESQNITVMKIPARSPNLNPYAESWVATIKRECLNHFLVLGEVHLSYLVNEFLNYYNTCRPHSAMNNEPLVKIDGGSDGPIRAKPFLGGLVHHYYRG